jgi:uncharacterized membrane protein YdbT with pleckstrin-like domain
MSFTKKQLMPGEKPVVIARQHLLVLFQPAALNVISLALLIFLWVYSGEAWFIAFMAAPLAWLFWKLLSWKMLEYILTDRRVVKQEGVFSITSFDAPLDKINNVYHQQSFLGRLLGYGEVGLETASEQGTTVFSRLSKPLDFKNSIMRQRELYGTLSKSSGSSLEPDIPKLIEDLASLRDRKIITDAEFEEKKKSLLEKL